MPAGSCMPQQQQQQPHHPPQRETRPGATAARAPKKNTQAPCSRSAQVPLARPSPPPPPPPPPLGLASAPCTPSAAVRPKTRVLSGTWPQACAPSRLSFGPPISWPAGAWLGQRNEKYTAPLAGTHGRSARKLRQKDQAKRRKNAAPGKPDVPGGCQKNLPFRQFF